MYSEQYETMGNTSLLLARSLSDALRTTVYEYVHLITRLDAPEVATLELGRTVREISKIAGNAIFADLYDEDLPELTDDEDDE
jgi:hypothetical protein